MALNPAIADCRLQGTATSPPSTTKFSMNFSIIQFNNKLAGGAEGDRTLDLSIANAALSQLSYGPVHHKIYLIFISGSKRSKINFNKVQLSLFLPTHANPRN